MTGGGVADSMKAAMRLPFIALLAVAAPLAAQDSTVTATDDTVAVAQAAVERFLAGRDQQPTEIWPQLVCVRMEGEEKWCTPSPEGRVAPAMRRLATAMGLPLGSFGRIPACVTPTAPGRGGAQLRIASLRLSPNSAQVGVALWCMDGLRARGNGCRYSVTRLGDRWVVRTGAPVTCFTS